MVRILSIFIVLFSTAFATAQERPSTILVLDASNSMWGQIDGTAKISIAQEVVGDLLTTLPEDQQLGLTVYGHRREGDCTDIETVVAPGAGTRDAISQAVNGISPRGRTPMTDAVIAAAEALGYTDNKATVILVSDGIETCNPDPCAAALALEKAGVDFTAHVIGFNINDPEAIAQMQCLAENTGGTFRTADNALELGDALTEVAVAEPEPEPAPDPITLTFRALLEGTDEEITDGLIWTFADDAAQTTGIGGGTTRQFLPGDYSVSVTRVQDDLTVSGDFFVEKLPKRVTLVLPPISFSATIEAVPEAPIGSTIDIAFDAPDATDKDFISIAGPDMSDGRYVTFAFADRGNPAEIVLPLEPGPYELRYVRNVAGLPDEVLARREIMLTDLSATLEAETQAGAGSVIDVAWDGPGYETDYISIALIGEDERAEQYASYRYARTGNPVELKLPIEPGDYELRYVANGNPDRVLGRRAIAVIAETATLEAAPEAVAGSVVEVTWDGPDNQNDYISVAQTDAKPSSYENYAYTRNGTPAEVRMPLDPGEYQLRYMANGSPDKVLAIRPITVVAPQVSLEAAPEAIAGSFVEVTWDGPSNQNDYISVAQTDAKAGSYENYAYVRNGNPAEVKMPLDPGQYQLRYVANGSPDKVLAAITVTVIEPQVALEAQAEATAGDLIEVTWDGPDNQNDYISVAEVGAKPGSYVQYAYTRNGTPAGVKMPLEPGEYELRYIANGSPDKVLASRPIAIVEADVAMEHRPDVAAGAMLEVFWTGPDNQGDYVSVAEADDKGYANYAYTRGGTPAVVQMPMEPGEYEIRYVANGSPDKVLERSTVTITPVTAIIEAEPGGLAGGEVEVTWDGPNYPRDYISITKVGERRYSTYANTRDGNPVTLKLPDEPGDYELRYMVNQGPTVLATRPFTVE